MTSSIPSPLVPIEGRLRHFLPADLYAEAWLDPSTQKLTKVFEHLRTLRRVLQDYTPRQLTQKLPTPGQLHYEWQEGTLMFTDLAGFTPLMEANARHGQKGASDLLDLLNTYFSTMLEIISKSSGDLLEFTGDALLIQFVSSYRAQDTLRAVRAGLRMQHAMEQFNEIETPQGTLSLGMRIGIHTGRFLTAEIGTPRRMEHVLMGKAVQHTKRAEGAGVVGRVCLTREAYERVQDQFYFDEGNENHKLVIDDGEEELDDYEITIMKRQSSALMLDRSSHGLIDGIIEQLDTIEPLACYLPAPVLNLIVENAARRYIPPQFTAPCIMFVNLMGIPQAADDAVGEELNLVGEFSRLFALINAAVESRGGILKRVTYHLYGSDILIVFGVPNAHTDDALRAAAAALAIREIIADVPKVVVGGRVIQVSCQIGLSLGPVFAGEIGDKRGRREFNVLSDTVNTAARLMARAESDTILITERVYHQVNERFECNLLGHFKLKGKAKEVPLYGLLNVRNEV